MKNIVCLFACLMCVGCAQLKEYFNPSTTYTLSEEEIRLAQQYSLIKMRRDANYDSVQTFVEKHPKEYQSLLNRFIEGKDTLTLAEMRLVYYGYSFTKDYDPYNAYLDIQNKYLEKDYVYVYPRCVEALKKNPVSLVLLGMACHSGEYCTNDEDILFNYLLRYNLIASTILASGTGKTEKDAFKVICVPDEYEVIGGLFQGNIKEHASILSGFCDVHNVVSNDTTSNVYFDISRFYPDFIP